MGLLEAILFIALIGVAVWAITSFIPMPAQFKQVIIVLSIIVIVLWLLQATGLMSGGPSIRIK